MTNMIDQPLSQKLSPSHSDAGLKFWMSHILPSAILVFALWLPFGFSLTGLIEEWGLLGLFTTHGLFFIADSTSPLAVHALRPLTILPQAVAYYLDPYSFKYWNILLALSLLIKGASLSYITNHITGSLKWGMIAGLLVIIYPADTMQLPFRALHINWALSSLLLGSAVLIAALQSRSKIVSYCLTITSAALLLVSCAMYEASLLLSVLPIGVILVKSNLKSAALELRKQIWKHIIWFTGALIYIAYVIHTAPLIKSYQSGFVDGTSVITTLINSLPNLFTIGLLRTVLGGWYDGARITAMEFSAYWYAASVTLILFAALFALLPKHKKTSFPASNIVSIRLCATGILLVLLGYAPFLLSVSHQTLSQRTFLYAAPGGVFVTIAILIGISKASKYVAALCATLLVFIGLSTQLYQFHHYVKISDRQRSILQNIVENFDGEIDNKTLVVTDNTNQLNNTWMFLNDNTLSSLSYIYGHPFRFIEVCHKNGREWQHPDNIGKKGSCEETASEWVFHYPAPINGPGFEPTKSLEDKRLAKSETVAITVDPDGKPKAHSNRAEMLRVDPSRTGAIYRGFIDKPAYHNALVAFTDQEASDHYFWGFGNWWSMDFPIAGSGWREGEWSVNKFQQNSLAWKTNKLASLDFKFSPSSDRYRLKVMFSTFTDPAIKTSMKLQINGINIPLEWADDNSFEANLVKSQLQDGINTIVFISDVDEKFYGFAGKLDWFEIKNVP